MENAVEAVKHEARRGETVLLSPGAASYDQFENFVRRGEVFASLVK
jgi:UDP-N-acetylmuramoylalanine--D-glutamate ligase